MLSIFASARFLVTWFHSATLPPIAATTALSGSHRIPLEERPGTETIPIESHPTSSTEYLLGKIRTHRTSVLLALLVIVIAAIAAVYFLRNRSTRTLPSSTATQIPAASPTAKRGTTNDEAYRHYLQGRNLVNQRNAADARKAIEYFEEAIRLDPNFAQPYASMANAYYSTGPEIEKARAALKKALELDPNLAEAYAIRGFLADVYDLDFTSGEKDLTYAIALEPNNDWAHWAFAQLLADTGRFDHALIEIETAQAIDPGTPLYERDRGRVLFYGRRYDEAVIQLQRAIELKRDFPSAWSWIVRACEMRGDTAGAYDWFIKWHEFKNNENTESYRQAYETGGWTSVKRKLVELVKLGKDYPEMSHYEIAWNLLLLGETAEAFSHLNKSVDKHEWEVTMLNIDPFLDGVRDDPRFTALLKKANFR